MVDTNLIIDPETYEEEMARMYGDMVFFAVGHRRHVDPALQTRRAGQQVWWYHHWWQPGSAHLGAVDELNEMELFFIFSTID